MNVRGFYLLTQMHQCFDITFIPHLSEKSSNGSMEGCRQCHAVLSLIGPSAADTGFLSISL